MRRRPYARLESRGRTGQRNPSCSFGERRVRRLVRMGNEGPCARLQSRGCGGGDGMWCLHLLFNSFNLLTFTISSSKHWVVLVLLLRSTNEISGSCYTPPIAATQPNPPHSPLSIPSTNNFHREASGSTEQARGTSRWKECQ